MTTNKRFWSVLSRVGVAMLLMGTAVSSWAGEPLRTCRVAGFRNEVKCGVIQRALDPAKPDGTRIDVHYVVVPAMARRKLPDPLFFFAGGPGQSAVQVASHIAQQLGRLSNRRDLVFVDQRGTGESAPLMCPDDTGKSLAQSLDSSQREADMRACLSQLQKLPYGDLRFFTTTIAMQDADAVRQILGVDKVNVYGISYGTRAALEYMRQFPGHVRRAVIDGVAPPDMVLPASVSMDNQAVLHALFQSCEQDRVCSRSYPHLRQSWSSLLASMPQTVTLTHPVTGVREPVRLTRELLLSALRGPLYAPILSSAMPYAIAQAAKGQFEPLLNLGGAIAPRGRQRPAVGMHMSVVCAEDMPRLGKTADHPGADFGSEFSQFYVNTCAFWPRGTVPAEFYAIPRIDAPTLVMSGTLDPVTPPRHGERVAQGLGPSARHIVVPHAGHGVSSLGCLNDVLFKFIDATDDADARAVDASCASKLPRPPVFIPVGYGTQGKP